MSDPVVASRPPFRKLLWVADIKPYWTSEERWVARGLLVVIVGLSLGEVYLNVLFNEWNNGFYSALQALDKPGYEHAIIRFCYLAAIFIFVAVYKTYLNQMLQIKWRRWMTLDYLSRWMSKQNYYRMQLAGNQMDNPDQRISDDIGEFITSSLGLSLDGLSSIVTLVSFLGILWSLSGPLDFNLNGTHVHIPAYMVWVAFAYAVVGTWLTFWIGRPLVKLNFEQQRFEANFRFSLVRLRENSESIAFYKGETQEEKGFTGRVQDIIGNWWQIMKRQKKLNWFTYGYGQIAIIFPFVVAAPRYFTKQMQLGSLMQTASAFGQVQGALSYHVDAYTSIAAWKAVTDRLNGFNESLAHAQEAQHTAGLDRQTQGDALGAEKLSITLPHGQPLLSNIDLKVAPGESTLITGRSGVGKSTLLRALAGLWPFAQGKVSWPQDARVLFVPQKPYLPLGTLAQVLVLSAGGGLSGF